MSNEVWTVLAVKHHDDGRTTLTIRNRSTGVVKTEDFPAGAVVDRVVGPAVDPS